MVFAAVLVVLLVRKEHRAERPVLAQVLKPTDALDREPSPSAIPHETKAARQTEPTTQVTRETPTTHSRPDLDRRNDDPGFNDRGRPFVRGGPRAEDQTIIGGTLQAQTETPPTIVFPQGKARPKVEITLGYYERNIEGFHVLISKNSYDQSDKLDRRPVGYLESELHQIADKLPRSTLVELAQVPIWVEWDHTVPGRSDILALYYTDWGEALLRDGVDPTKQKSVCMLSLKAAYDLRSKGKRKQLVLLHELAHAVHDQVLGLKNTIVANAYKQAETKKLYERVIHDDKSIKRALAGANPQEYFAELTCAYLDQLDYAPHNRDELKDVDSAGYDLMYKVWGEAEHHTKKKKPKSE